MTDQLQIKITMAAENPARERERKKKKKEKEILESEGSALFA